MGVIYFMFMMIGVITVRVPAPRLEASRMGAFRAPQPLVTLANVSVDVAWRTPQFWLLWACSA